jgi:hypothetical protein
MFFKTLQVVIELPLNLQPITPGHQANWDLVSDLVSSNYNRYYRSANECRKRFESVILKREEQCLVELQTKKQLQIQQQQQQQQAGGAAGATTNQKIKNPPKVAPLNICKTKTLRTNQMCIQDNNRTLLHNIKRRFDKIVNISKRRRQFTFSNVSTNKQVNQQQQQQQLQQQELFLSRLNTSGGNLMAFQNNQSPFVLNAMNSVANAFKVKLTNIFVLFLY